MDISLGKKIRKNHVEMFLKVFPGISTNRKVLRSILGFHDKEDQCVWIRVRDGERVCYPFNKYLLGAVLSQTLF